MTFPHDPAAHYPIVPKPPASKARRRWPWIAAAVIALLIMIGRIAPDTDTPPVQAADSTSLTTTSAAPTTPASTTVPPATTSVSLLAAPAAVVLVDSPAAATTALTQLGTLEVKGRAPKTGYDRDLFGQSWSDDVTVDGGHNGCDTRNDVLRRDLTAIVTTDRSGGCVVSAGVLADPYTGTSIAFTRGEDTSSAVQIDHVVALSDAWQKGAQQLDSGTLRNLANDPRNLQAVDGPTNSAKGDGDAATWLPPNHEYRCTYVARQVQIKAEYRLWVTDAERDAIAGILTSCGAAGTTAIITTAPEPAPWTEEPQIEQAVVPAPAPPQVYTPEPAPLPAPQAATVNPGGGGGSCGADSYINSAGNCVHSPVQAPSAPAGATAQCSDGTYSYSQSRRGTCSHHGGVSSWL
ncbi:DUF3761 domain-containing protein [Rhodococcus sp. IEGM1428]|uniref:DUF3761 domain-containing protein n=1 Tax=Rhodococcus sp. IEGM1428 TaxID=3392191 RepID=UPI003D0F1C5B